MKATVVGCCGEGAHWNAEGACDGFGPTPLPEVLTWAGTYTGRVMLYLHDHGSFEGTCAEDGGK